MWKVVVEIYNMDIIGGGLRFIGSGLSLRHLFTNFTARVAILPVVSTELVLHV